MTDNLDNLIAERADIDERLEQLRDRKAQIDHDIRQLGEGRHQAPSGATITISAPQRRFDPLTALGIVTDPGLLASCSETKISATKARQILPPAVYDLCCTPVGEGRITIKDAR